LGSRAAVSFASPNERFAKTQVISVNRRTMIGVCQIFGWGQLTPRGTGRQPFFRIDRRR
jgi:hypothetical protein